MGFYLLAMVLQDTAHNKEHTTRNEYNAKKKNSMV
jgi:hypothetical protein